MLKKMAHLHGISLFAGGKMSKLELDKLHEVRKEDRISVTLWNLVTEMLHRYTVLDLIKCMELVLYKKLFKL